VHRVRWLLRFTSNTASATLAVDAFAGFEPLGSTTKFIAMITSRDNRWLKQFRAALRGTGPAADEPIGVEGAKLVEDGLRSGLAGEALLFSESGEAAAGSILAAAGESEAGISRSRILKTTDKLFSQIAGTEAPQGVAALFRQPVWGLEDVLRGPGVMRERSPLVVVLAAVQDPGNVGTIVRSAEAFGATGIIASRGTADPWSPKAIRASAGAVFRLPLLRGMATPVLMAQLRIAGVKIFAASSHPQNNGSRSAGSEVAANLQEPAALFIGNEGSGLPLDVTRSADAFIAVPMNENVESLNAGVAASIILYEAARARSQS